MCVSVCVCLYVLVVRVLFHWYSCHSNPQHRRFVSRVPLATVKNACISIYMCKHNIHICMHTIHSTSYTCEQRRGAFVLMLTLSFCLLLSVHIKCSCSLHAGGFMHKTGRRDCVFVGVFGGNFACCAAHCIGIISVDSSVGFN